MYNSSGNTTGSSTFMFDHIDSLEMTFFVFQCSLLPLSLFGNVLILTCIFKYHWLRSPINYLVANLAASDLLVVLASSPLGIVGKFLGMEKYRYVCLLDLAAFCALLLVSVSNMLAISIDRYVSVTFPFEHKARAMIHVKRFILCTWIATSLYSLIPVMGWNYFSDDVRICKPHLVWPYLYQTATTTYLVMAIIFKIIFFSLVVRVAIQKMPDARANNHLRRRVKKTYVMIVISALFIVCWMPYCIVTLQRVFMHSDQLKAVQGWTFLLVIVNSSINWMVYGLKTAKFRKAFKMLLCRKSTLDVSREQSTSSYT